MQDFVLKQLVEQLQAVQADKARVAEENARLATGKRESPGNAQHQHD